MRVFRVCDPPAGGRAPPNPPQPVRNSDARCAQKIADKSEQIKGHFSHFFNSRHFLNASLLPVARQLVGALAPAWLAMSGSDTCEVVGRCAPFVSTAFYTWLLFYVH